jgi:hypothetical protein
VSRSTRRDHRFVRALLQAQRTAPHTWALYESVLMARLPTNPTAREAVETLTVALGEFAQAGRDVTPEEEADVRQFMIVASEL